MEKVMPLFEYEPLVLFPKPETSNEEEYKRDIDGARTSGTKIVEQPRDLKRGKDSPKREAIEQTLEQVKFVLQEVNFQEYVFATTKIGERIEPEEHIIQEDQ
jgi:hypothetical protein